MENTDTDITKPTNTGRWLQFIIINSAIVVTLITGIFYVIGAQHTKGYLDTFGLNESQFPNTVATYLLKGVSAAMDMSMSPLVWIVTIAFLGFIFLGIWDVIYHFIRQKRPHWAENINSIAGRISTTNKADAKLVEPSKVTKVVFAIAVYSALVTALYIVVLIIVSSDSRKNGKWYADKLKGECEASRRIITEVNLKSQNSPMCGCTIVCNPQQCAYLVVSEFGFGPRLTTVVTNNDGRIHSQIELKEED